MVIEAFKNNIPSIKFSPCGKYLAGASIDKTIRVFDVQTL
jgi:WD40 repeat protein